MEVAIVQSHVGKLALTQTVRTSENWLHNSCRFSTVVFYSFCLNKNPFDTCYFLVNFFKRVIRSLLCSSCDGKVAFMKWHPLVKSTLTVRQQKEGLRADHTLYFGYKCEKCPFLAPHLYQKGLKM